jgi:hypothetical protein
MESCKILQWKLDDLPTQPLDGTPLPSITKARESHGLQGERPHWTRDIVFAPPARAAVDGVSLSLVGAKEELEARRPQLGRSKRWQRLGAFGREGLGGLLTNEVAERAAGKILDHDKTSTPTPDNRPPRPSIWSARIEFDRLTNIAAVLGDREAVISLMLKEDAGSYLAVDLTMDPCSRDEFAQRVMSLRRTILTGKIQKFTSDGRSELVAGVEELLEDDVRLPLEEQLRASGSLGQARTLGVNYWYVAQSSRSTPPET